MIKFLTLSEILLILEDQIKNYGGVYGARDLKLLSSAMDLFSNPVGCCGLKSDKSCKILRILPVNSGSCSKTEVFEQP